MYHPAMKHAAVLALLVAALALVADPAAACTNLLVTPGASADGSALITYTCDGPFHPRLRHRPAADHAADAVVELRSWDGTLRGTIPQVPHTFAVVGLQNEHQLVIAETTTTGREELENPDGLLHYWDLMQLALQRAKTAREAVAVMTDLVQAHGYRSTAEAFSIADPNEVWLLEMTGTGPGGEGALWVALRVPDGYVSAHANGARIGEVPAADPATCRFSPNLVTFAVERGWYDPAAGKPFRFDEVYGAHTPQTLRYTATRVWSLFRRLAPSLALTPDRHRGVAGAEDYPLWVKPDRRLTLADVMALMRDHYEGTPYDMTRGVDAGPFGSPYRPRPMAFEVDGQRYSWERPISTPQSGFSFVSQSRSWLPDPVGGVTWYGVDDTFTTCYFPVYCGVDRVPESFATGSLGRFSWDSAYWVFNFVANFANLRYSAMIQDIQAVQRELEGHLLALQPAVELVAVALHNTDRALLGRYLTDYSVTHGEEVVRRWRDLAERLVAKYNDGYVQGTEGDAEEVGYPEEWRRRVVRERGEELRVEQTEPPASELPY